MLYEAAYYSEFININVHSSKAQVPQSILYVASISRIRCNLFLLPNVMDETRVVHCIGMFDLFQDN
jgi:hypothetical protein